MDFENINFSRDLGANEIIWECTDDVCLPVVFADPEQFQLVNSKQAQRVRRNDDGDYLNMMMSGLTSAVGSTHPETHCLKVCNFDNCQNKGKMLSMKETMGMGGVATAGLFTLAVGGFFYVYKGKSKVSYYYILVIMKIKP